MRVQWVAGGLLIAFVASLGLVYWYPPAEYNFYPKCILHQVTGLHCPGCGGTRAMHHLVHGRLLEACRMNIMTTVFLPGLLLVLIWQKVVIDPKKPFFSLTASPRIQWCLGMGVIAFGIARNIPLPPFSWLAPH